MSYNPYTLENKTILITGASSGIGRVTAVECSKMGARVIITGRNRERLEETFNMLQGENNLLVYADLSIDEDISKLIDALPKINGAVLNAGISKLKPVQFIKECDLQDILKVNTIAPIILVQQMLKKKMIEKGASLVFTSSVSGNTVFVPGHALYSVSKAALTAFTKNAAMDLGAKLIRCNCVMPGMVETDLIHNSSLSQEDLDRDKKNYPLGRYGEPKDIALGVIYLLSDASSWVTGTSLVIDGGFTLK